MIKKPILVRCEPCEDGYIIAWQASNLQWGRVLEIIKSIPREEREFLPEEKAWWLSAWAYEYLTSYIQFGKKRERSQRSPNPSSLPQQIAEAYQVLCITPNAPMELVKAAQRVLAKQYHPDRGGSHTAMVAVNNAADIVTNWLASAQQKGA
jgi:hypothetical protein